MAAESFPNDLYVWPGSRRAWSATRTHSTGAATPAATDNGRGPGIRTGRPGGCSRVLVPDRSPTGSKRRTSRGVTTPVAGQIGYTGPCSTRSNPDSPDVAVEDRVRPVRRASGRPPRHVAGGELADPRLGGRATIRQPPSPGGPPTVSRACRRRELDGAGHRRHHAGAELADDGDRAGVG